MRAAARLESAEHLHHLCAVEAGHNQPYAQSARTIAAVAVRSVQRAQRTAAGDAAPMEGVCVGVEVDALQPLPKPNAFNRASCGPFLAAQHN